MKKSSQSSSTFGAPKPLPGQAGYKETETDRLKRDADEMEARLQLLQDRMQTQQATGGAQAGRGSWKSGSADKGSIRAYGKEVNDKVKKKLEATGGGDPALRSTLSSKRTVKTQEVDFKSKDVTEWNVGDVSAWLSELQLQQYVSAFAQNAISGSVLVDITAEDLDYMDIKALGHRKVILKSVEDMRRTGSYTPGAVGSPQKMPDILRTVSNPNMGDGGSERSMMSMSMQVSGTKKSPTEVKTTHWSNLEPIANNKVSNPRGGMINPADDEPGGMLDEAAERAAFAEAVAEWRRADAEAAATGNKKPLAIEREYITGPSKPAAKSAAGTATGTAFGEDAGGMSMWKNPFAPPTRDDDKEGHAVGEVLDEAAERKAFQEAVMEWRRGPTTASSQAKAPAPVSSTTSATTTFTAREKIGFNDSFESDHGLGYHSPGRDAGAKGTGTLLNGQLDEAREHEEFVKAVDSWREGKGTAAGSKTSSSTSSQALADKISQELEAAKEAMSLKLQKQKEEAERRMQEANLELKRLRSAKSMREDDNDLSEYKTSGRESKHNNDYDDDDDEDVQVEVEPTFTYSYSSAPSSRTAQGARAAPELKVSPRVTSDSVAPTPRVDVEEKESVSGPQSSVGVSLVESVLGYHSSSRAEGKDSAEDYYVVEVDSDED